MIRSEPSDDIHAFLDFMIRTLGEPAVRARQPACDEDVARFVTLARLPLPPLYLDYLKEFGAGDGALKMADDANPRVAALIQLYEEQHPSDPDVPANGVVIGAFGMSGERTLLYSAATAEPQVVVSWWGRVGHVSAQTFRNHLHRQAFVRGAGQDIGSHCSLYRNDPAFLPHARQHVEALGFVAHWFSDDHQCCLERDDGSFFYIERAPERTSLYGCLPDTNLRDQLKTQLMTSLELTDSTPGRR